MSFTRRVIDLTQPIEERMPVSIGHPHVMLHRYLDRSAGDVATVELLLLSLHAGTHVDAPMHFVAGGPCVDELDPLALCGPAVVIDVAGDGNWKEISPAELDAWEAAASEQVQPGDIVLLRSGHARHWTRMPAGVRYLTTPWPYLDQAGARWLLTRKIRALGVECPDPDRVDQRDIFKATFPAHRLLLSAGVPIIENLAHLDHITNTRFEFRALALPIAGASGSPVRALAILPGERDNG
jgi:kynurenine formamidase